MKKVVYVLLLTLLLGYNVYAQDTIHSLNDYNNAELIYLIRNEDSNVIAGRYLDKNKFSHFIVLKYSDSGNVLWEYKLDSAFPNYIYGITNNKNNEYIIVYRNDTNEDIQMPLQFIKLDDKGNSILEHTTELPPETLVTKIIRIEDEESNLESYIIIGSLNNKAFLAKYNENLDQEWLKQYDGNFLGEIIYFDHVGYYALEYDITEKNINYKLIKLDTNGEYLSNVIDTFETNDQPHLLKEDESYILYGYSEEVKIGDDTGSFYIKKYDLSDSLEWETVGNNLVKYNALIKLQALAENKYLILTTNAKDNSIELTKILDFGIKQEKIKKLKNNYYSINDFASNKDTIYFIGQITCPENDNCDYNNNNSLFLISSPDKVVEVKEKNGKSIIIITVLLLIGTVIIYSIRKTKKKH